MSKLSDLVGSIKFALEDVVYSIQNKVLNIYEYVKYDILKKDYDLPEFKIEDDIIEEAPKKKKKTKKKKKK